MVRAQPYPGGTVGAVMKGRLPAVLAATVLLATACGNSGAPTSYDDNPADYQFDANSPLEPDVGQAERNFRDGCKEAGGDDLDERVQDNLSEVCKCSFDDIREALTFDEFKQLDDDLRSDINADLTEQVSEIMRRCILEESGIG